MASILGSNVINYSTNTGNDSVEAAKKRIAELGQQWNSTTDQKTKDALHAQATSIGTNVGGSFNSGTGTWDFSGASKSTADPNTTPSANPSSLIDSIYENNKNAQLQALKKARETALQGLNGVETQAKQGAFDNRNSADAVSMQNAQRLKETMANNGLLASGDNITANSNLAANRQAEMGNINRAEQNTLTDVSERRATINNNAALDEQALMQQLLAAKDNMLLNDLYKSKDYALQEAGLTGVMQNGDKTLAGKTYDRGVLESDRNYNHQVGRDSVADAQWKQQFNEQVKQFGITSALQRQIQMGNLSIDQARLILQQDDNDRQWASLDWNMSKPDSSGSDYRGLSASQVLDNIKSRYTDPVMDGNQFDPKKIGEKITSDPVKREQMFLDVVDSGLPTDTETKQVLSMLGFTKAEIEAYKKKYPGN